ncbi:PilZ domain-containing protein [Ferrimonas balearica]|uniref:PilZ domain-containing protein n=1 Tax=Ferrimonas balearica TaxID=44012 RepID=UPI001C99BF10|nr:PilZ domain-containing protein [Ferrimonas balearica]MBY5993863.1 PilZ domain-containing protein [Ferrimonas balearica]
MSDADPGYFSVPSQFDALLDPISEAQLWLPEPELEAAMPKAFRLMAQVTDLEGRCLPLLKGMEQHAKALAEYLSLQSQKIDLVLQQQLAQDPNAGYRAEGLQFGGSGIRVRLAEPLPQGQALALRVFLADQHVAVFAHGEVSDCQPQGPGFELTITFTAIRESDQDRLVRASLMVQQRQLRERAERRRGAGEAEPPSLK